MMAGMGGGGMPGMGGMGGMPDLGGMAGGDSDDEEGEESTIAPHTNDDKTTAADSKKADGIDDLDGEEVNTLKEVTKDA